MSSSFDSLDHTYINYVATLFKGLYDDPEITEFAINKLGEFWYEKNGIWEHRLNNRIDEPTLYGFTRYLATVTNKTFESMESDNTANLLFSTAIPETHDRYQIVSPPISADFSLTLRKPSKNLISLERYLPLLDVNTVKSMRASIDSSYRDLVDCYQNCTKNYLDFLVKAVKYGLNIVICGGTGSGKTTFMKSLMQCIDTDERIITIEDSPEIALPKHKNIVNLFYESEAIESSKKVTPRALIASTLRMKPDRIILAELRGSETYDFINAVSTGHKGSLTSLHASSIPEAKQRLLMMMKGHELANSYSTEELRDLIDNNIDVYVTMESHKGSRFFKDVYFNIDKTKL